MLRLLLIICACVYTTAATEKCKSKDGVCLLNLSKKLYSSMFENDNGLDPMHHDIIEGNLSIIHYKFIDTTATGFKDCVVEDVSSDFQKLVQIELICPRLMMYGKYEVKGRLDVLPVEGNGNYTIDASKYRIKMKLNIELQPEDGKTYMHITSFTVEAEPLEGIKFDFDNLFNGNKELADVVHAYVNQNWKKIAKEVQDPIFIAHLNKISKVANEYSKKTALEDHITLS